MSFANHAEIIAIQDSFLEWRRNYPEAYFALADLLKDHGGYAGGLQTATEIMEQLTLLVLIDPEGRR